MKNTLICSRTAEVHVLLRHVDVIWLVYSYLFYKCGGAVVRAPALEEFVPQSLCRFLTCPRRNAVRAKCRQCKKIIISCLYYLKLMRIKLFVHVVCVFFYQFAKFNVISLVTVDEMVS